MKTSYLMTSVVNPVLTKKIRLIKVGLFLFASDFVSKTPNKVLVFYPYTPPLTAPQSVGKIDGRKAVVIWFIIFSCILKIGKLRYNDLIQTACLYLDKSMT
ncbi:hypothetical protein LU290_02080 [Moraxella nasibovis]|uniref:hypothetical protein n=1 Tax=Moraxella nasibovis TaxID=2904120 RepID=UPI0024107818|nr:hypothetical protein [Moraxella nasibovis]WFF39043.1 hypothetical protein LU290_02080 [Moraxella nasibovis]